MKLLKFSATWCGPCKVMTNRLKPLEESQPNLLSHIDIDAEESLDLVSKFNVRSVPTLILVNNDVELERWVGIIPLSTIQDSLNEHSTATRHE